MAAKSLTRRALTFHSICFLISIIGCSYELVYIKLQIFDTYGGRFKFLTHCSQYVHTAFFAFAVLVDIQEIFADDKKVKETSKVNNPKHQEDGYSFTEYLRDLLFVAICFPFGILIVALFWGITFIERGGGVMSDETRKMVPLSSLYNHFLHTFPLFLNIAALYLLPHKYPRRRIGISVVSTLAVAYIAWLVHIGNHTGIWCYPFLQHQTMAEFVVFLICATVAAIGVYVFGEKLSSIIWKRDCLKNA